MAERKTNNGGDEKPFLTDEDKKLLRKQYEKDYREHDVEMFIRRCERSRIDPMTGQIWLRPEGKEDARGKDGKFPKALTITGIQGFLDVADRSGVYDNEDPFLWCGQDGEWVDVWLEDAHPYAAKVSVWRKDRTRPNIAIVKWKAVSKGSWAWNSMPDHMLAKCAHAAALRRAFPSQLTGIYETDEIVDKTSPVEQDIKDQEKRIVESQAAAERLAAQGVPSVEPKGPAFPAERDAKAEVEPAKGQEPQGYQPGDESQEDNLDMSPAGDGARKADWWMYVMCDPMKNAAYVGKQVQELSPSLLRQAVEKWCPKVRKPEVWKNTSQTYRDLAEALEIGWEQAQQIEAQAEAKKAAATAEGAQ